MLLIFFNLSKLYLDWHYNERKSRYFSFDLTKDEAAKQKIEEHRIKVYDSNLYYVVGCKLRGHSQHSVLPVKSFNTGLRYDPDKSKHTASFRIYYDHDDLVRIKVPNQMLHKDINIDLTDIIDGFVFAVSQVHMLNRELTEPVVNESRSAIFLYMKVMQSREALKNIGVS